MIYKFLHSFLACVTLLSSSGFVMRKHYCKNELKKYALYIQPAECETHPQEKPLCPLHAQHDTKDQPTSPSEQKGCCKNEIELLKLELPFQVSTFDLTILPSDLFIEIGEPPLNRLVGTHDKDVSHFLTYKPPPLVCNLAIHLQTFLL